jgi:putative transposase
MIKHLVEKEKSLMNNINHCISKAILKFAVENGVSVMDFENLTGIRDRTNNNLRNKQKYLHNSSGLLTNYNNSLSLK